MASSSPSCRIRNIATRALDKAGVPWTEIFLGRGSFAVVEAVAVGLAVSMLRCRLAPPGTIEVSRRFGLPTLPSSEIVLLSTLSDAKIPGGAENPGVGFSRTPLTRISATAKDRARAFAQPSECPSAISRVTGRPPALQNCSLGGERLRQKVERGANAGGALEIVMGQ